MTITVSKLLAGLITSDATAYINQIKDGIDALSNQNVIISDVENIVEYIDADANVITILGANGVVPAGAIADSSDKTYKTVEIAIPSAYVKQLKIGRQQFTKFGISPSDLDVSAKRFGFSALNSLVQSGALASELNKMYNDFYQWRRNQVHTFLAGLSNSSLVYQKTADGDYLVADSRTGNLYDFDNKGTASLSESEFKVGLNAIAKQIDARGNEIGVRDAQYLFSTSGVTLPFEILKPSEVVNSAYRSSGDMTGSLPSGVKFAGVYKNSSDVNDWVLICEGHKIERIVMSGYETPQVRIAHDVINDIIVIEMSDRTIVKCTSPECIYGAIVS